MKRTLLCIIVLVATAVAVRAQSVSVYIHDNDGPYSNVRNKPGGAIVDRIPVDASAMFEVDEPTNGWWHIMDGCYYALGKEDFEEFTLKGSESGYWIHYSVIAVGTRNYDGSNLYLRAKPEADAPVSYTLKGEQMVRPIDVKGEWVKVKTLNGKGTGWIDANMLCGNSVTNCS